MVNLVEFAVISLVVFVVIAAGFRIVGDSALGGQLVLWIANVLMLVTIWIGLRLRGQTWAQIGLNFRRFDRPTLLHAVMHSMGVFALALLGFGLGAFVMGMIMGAPEASDMSSYQYLQGNLPMLLLALAGVYVVSSFGEEVIYRGFLMTRIAEMGGDKRWTWFIAAIISAIVFGLIHFGWGLFGMVQTAFMGLALAISYLLVKRNLWVLILAHAYLDTLLLVQLYLTPSPG